MLNAGSDNRGMAAITLALVMAGFGVFLIGLARFVELFRK